MVSLAPSSAQTSTPEEQEALRVRVAENSVLRYIYSRLPRWLRPSRPPSVPAPAISQISSDDLEFGNVEKQEPIFYLAYGSNLSAETFRGRRGIKPISEVNVCVPSLRLTFDLPGLPYAEPCFANTARRDPNAAQVDLSASMATQRNPPRHEKTPLLQDTSDTSAPSPPDTRYHKDTWHKPLVGVLYELTPSDYAHVIATEGGGASYQDITVDCYLLPESSSTVPMHPNTTPIAAHTLFAPAVSHPPGDPDAPTGGRFQRPDPSYAQASARYLKLIADGAAEHALPQEYRDYIAQIRPYRLTTQKQRMGSFLFTMVWVPLVMFMFAIQNLMADDKGRSPKWLGRFAELLFSASWLSYDGFFTRLFGDGERTIGE